MQGNSNIKLIVLICSYMTQCSLVHSCRHFGEVYVHKIRIYQNHVSNLSYSRTHARTYAHTHTRAHARLEIQREFLLEVFLPRFSFHFFTVPPYSSSFLFPLFKRSHKIRSMSVGLQGMRIFITSRTASC